MESNCLILFRANQKIKHVKWGYCPNASWTLFGLGHQPPLRKPVPISDFLVSGNFANVLFEPPVYPAISCQNQQQTGLAIGSQLYPSPIGLSCILRGARGVYCTGWCCCYWGCSEVLTFGHVCEGVRLLLWDRLMHGLWLKCVTHWNTAFFSPGSGLNCTDKCRKWYLGAAALQILMRVYPRLISLCFEGKANNEVQSKSEEWLCINRMGICILSLSVSRLKLTNRTLFNQLGAVPEWRTWFSHSPVIMLF